MMRFLTLLAFLANLFGGAALADGDPVRAELLPGWRLPGGDHIAALRLELAPGWKTYWRAPGDAGIPPVFNWSGSKNVSNVEIIWPTPIVFEQNGLRSIGYKEELVLPLRITPRRMARPVRLRTRLDMGICRDICVPRNLTLSARLPVDSNIPNAEIVAAMADRPWSETEADVTSATCHIQAADKGLALRASVQMPSIGGREIAVIETDNPELWVAEAKTGRKGGWLHAETRIIHNQDAAFALNRAGIRITVFGASHSVDILGCSASQ